MTRRLAAVMITDMVGFTTKAQRNEVEALQLLEEHRGVVRGTLREFQGREVKTLGDGFLIEFADPLAAGECAIEILRRLDARNRATRAERIDLRVGIHLGEVTAEGTDILGDAVNVASRLEPLAEPGGIVVSGPVYDQLQGRLSLPLRAIGTPPLKHVFVPITLYRVELPWRAPPVPDVTPWVDREPETTELREACGHALEGHGRAVIVLGDPGTGKTRLVEELVREATGRGFRLLKGQGLRGTRAEPYGLWAEAVRSFVRTAEPRQLARVCGEHVAELARLVPEVYERIGTSPPAPPREPEHAEERLMAGIVQFFVNLAAEEPVLLFLDDLQWADAYSQRLSRRAANAVGGHRWLFVAAAREHDPSSSPGTGALWEDLRAVPDSSVLRLGPFAPVDFERFLYALLPPPGIAPELRQRVLSLSDGNPLFAEELVRRQIEAGALRPSDEGWTLDPSAGLKIPETIQQLLRERLAALDPATVQLLRGASVAGGRISYSLLRTIGGIPEDLLVICLERALQARILEERPATGGEIELAFRDPLTRDVLYDDLSLVRKQSYHRKVAEGLENLPPAGRRELASQLAEHFLRGNLPAKALEYSLVAAGRAVELHAHPEAEQAYRTALELMDELPTPEPRRPETHRALAKELELLGRTSAAIEQYAISARLWEEGGELRRASAVHSWMSMLLNDVPGQEGQVVAHAEKAVGLLRTEGDSAELAQATYSLAAEVLRWDAEVGRARELFRRSVELAVRFGDSRTEAFGTYFMALTFPMSRKSEAIDLARRLADKLEAANDPTLPTILFNVATNLFLGAKGDVETARRFLEKAREVARRNRVTRHDTAIALGLAELDRYAGAWGAAESVARGVLAREPEEHVLERVEASLLLGRLATSRGLLEEAGRILTSLEAPAYRSLFASPEGKLPLALLRSEFELERGDRELAYEAIAPVLNEGVASEPTLSNALVWVSALSLGITLSPDPADASSTGPWLEALRRTATELDEPWARAWQLRAEGLVAGGTGNLPFAITLLGSSRDRWVDTGWPFEIGKAYYLLGHVQRRARRAEAAGLLDQAVERFAALGAGRYLERARADRLAV